MMRKMSKGSRKSTGEIMTAATSFFGAGGLGLTETDRAECCVTFEGGGGFVRVTTNASDGGSEVEVETSEWEQAASRFLVGV